MADETAERWCRGYLRISSEEMSAGEIGAALAAEADLVVVKGQPLSKRNPASAISALHIWSLDSKLPDSADADVHLDFLVRFMEAHEVGLAALAGKCEMDIVCSVDNPTGQRALLLLPSMIARLARFGVQLSYDLYG